MVPEWYLFKCLESLQVFSLSADLFQRQLTFPKISFRNNVNASNSLDPDQARLKVGPDLGLNFLHRL